jgi:hypothetical protein
MSVTPGRMDIQAVLKTINQMQADGVIERYAIGGAVGATFYLEPVATLDVDVFVGLVSPPGRLVLSLQAIFDYLKAHGATVEGEYMVIAGWPVQFLPPGNPLIVEALNEAVGRNVAGTVARVFTAEHLAAIALQTGRAKDKARLLQFLEANALDLPRFETILARHDLIARWRHFQRQFLSDAP